MLNRLAACTAPFVAAMAVAAPSAGVADVLEIGAAGAVTVYAGPSVYTSEGVRAILISRPKNSSGSSISALLRSAAERQAMSADLLEAVAWKESRFRHSAVSPKGAVGVMQIMPATALALGVDRYDLQQNIEGGAAYLRLMLNRYSGSVPLALAAYNAGPTAVDRYRGIPPYRETQAYVAAIVARLAGAAAPAAKSLQLIEP